MKINKSNSECKIQVKVKPMAKSKKYFSIAKRNAKTMIVRGKFGTMEKWKQLKNVTYIKSVLLDSKLLWTHKGTNILKT